MAKGNRNVNQEAEATSAQSETVETQQSEATTPAVNMVAVFKRNHPQNRASYGIPGVPGIIVVQRDLVAGTTPVSATGTELGGMPAELNFGVALASPKVDNKQAKAEAAALKAKEKADKAAAKVLAQQAKAEEKAAKAKQALEEAQARAQKAAADAAAKAEAPATTEGVESL